MKHIYLILSATHTIPARMVRIFTNSVYSHASVSLCEDLSDMCSFSRTRIGNPLVGGYTRENPNTLMLGKNHYVPVKIFKIPVTDKGFKKSQRFIERIKSDKEGYLYNLLNFFTAAFGRFPKVYKSFICTTFSARVISEGGALPRELKLKLHRLTPNDLERAFTPFLVFEGPVDTYHPAMKACENESLDTFFTHAGFVSETKRTYRYIRCLLRRRAMMKGRM